MLQTPDMNMHMFVYKELEKLQELHEQEKQKVCLKLDGQVLFLNTARRFPTLHIRCKHRTDYLTRHTHYKHCTLACILHFAPHRLCSSFVLSKNGLLNPIHSSSTACSYKPTSRTFVALGKIFPHHLFAQCQRTAAKDLRHIHREDQSTQDSACIHITSHHTSPQHAPTIQEVDSMKTKFATKLQDLAALRQKLEQ